MTEGALSSKSRVLSVQIRSQAPRIESKGFHVLVSIGRYQLRNKRGVCLFLKVRKMVLITNLKIKSLPEKSHSR